MVAVEVDAGGVLVVQVERERGVVKLRAHAVGAAERAGHLHLPDDFGRQRLAGLVVLGKGLQQLFVAEKLLQHLRRHFNEVALRSEAGEPGPLRVAAQDGVHQVAEFMEVRHHVVVLHQARIARRLPPGKLQISAASGR